ncbi:MAG: hypothetical protein DCC75_06260 [Proteobacteria bacterium]|nr:MAG: hypothetical protein DCC75_06260 [Pseudomonadota bacterium]
MNEVRPRLSSEVLKRGYSDDEVKAIYALARFCIENGDLNRAALLVQGLKEVSPEFGPLWLMQAYIDMLSGSYESATAAASQALKIWPESVEAELFLAASALATGDYNSAGTFLGEVREKVESGQIDDPNIVRFYRTQLVRFQSR